MEMRDGFVIVAFSIFPLYLYFVFCRWERVVLRCEKLRLILLIVSDTIDLYSMYHVWEKNPNLPLRTYKWFLNYSRCLINYIEKY